jgi:hypothetical protein
MKIIKRVPTDGAEPTAVPAAAEGAETFARYASRHRATVKYLRLA